MKLRTEIEFVKKEFQFDYSSKIALLGSCFSDEIGGRLKGLKFNTSVNPFGTLFNPLSIAKLLTDDAVLSENCFVERDGLFFHHSFHSSFYAASKAELKQKCDSVIQETKTFLADADLLIITLGTAFIYERKENGGQVANCHKVPQSKFTKRLCKVDEVVNSIVAIQNKFPHIKIMCTVSPVRHTKDTLELNAVSKSILRLACYELGSCGVEYFPSFEIMNDDLRDYRFFKSDLIHPSDLAVDYIWDKFFKAFTTIETQEIAHKIQKIVIQLNHRVQATQSEAHKNLLKKTLAQMEELVSVVDFENEISTLKIALKSFS